tara:strand:- start:55 stop:258 length:204 start_codon:yes stop_codon:yes gene_type:complete
MEKKMQISNDFEALKLGLKLAITAPSETEMKKTMKLVFALQNNLSKEEIDLAKKEIEKELENESKTN